MAESRESSQKDVYSANDPIEINELMSLNNDISNDFIEQLQNQISNNTAPVQNNEDAALFEEPATDTNSAPGEYEDAFMKKFREKQMRKQMGVPESPAEQTTSEPEEERNAESNPEPELNPEPVEETAPEQIVVEENIPEENPAPQITNDEITQEPETDKNAEIQNPQEEEISVVTGGNITEKKIDDNFAEYKNNLDYLDNNVKYSKYVVYIDPENKDFIDSLTVKERKNLINRIIREQDSVSVTKRKLKNMQTIIVHAIIAIMTVTIAIPAIYFMINASLEATINNYKNSQTTFGQLYKTHSKIKPINQN